MDCRESTPTYLTLIPTLDDDEMIESYSQFSILYLVPTSNLDQLDSPKPNHE
jgi:hypothetical protein